MSDIEIKVLARKTLIAFLGVFLMGFGIAFNSLSLLGNDPISVLYDGLKTYFNISLGMASNIANCLLILIMIIFVRNRLNVGTFIYTLTLGLFINLGARVYNLLHVESTLSIKIFSSVTGCLLLFLGIAIYIVIDFGLDTWSGVTTFLSEKSKMSYKTSKILMDVLCFAIGFLLGGVVGVTTLFAAILGGPIIEKLCNVLKKPLLSFTEKNNN